MDTIIKHSSKTEDGIIYSLLPKDYEHHVFTDDEGFIQREETIGEKISVYYRDYKYRDTSITSSMLEELVSDLAVLLLSSELVNGYTHIAAIPNKDNERLKNLVKRIGKKLNLEYVDILSSKGEDKMKDTDYYDRPKRLNFLKCDQRMSDDAKLILIDDFVETGTTFREAIRAIRECNPNILIKRIAFFRTHGTWENLE